MKCPNDQTTLVITERQNIEIDYCPECRGVWLDRGELDKIIERSQSPVSAPQFEASHHQPTSQRSQAHYSGDYHHKTKRKESFLGELFDF